MDGIDFKTVDGWKKFLAFVIGVAGTVLVGFGISQIKIDQILAVATTLSPFIAMIAYFIVNQIASAGKASTTVKMASIAADVAIAKQETIAEIAKESPEAAAEVMIATATPVASAPPITTTIPSTDEEVKVWQQKVKDDIDQELADSFKLSTPDAARKAHPELSSLNPSIVWSKTQSRLMDSAKSNISRGNYEAIYATEKLLRPAADAALVDQRGQTLEGGIKCQWPPSYMASSWVDWCNQHIQGLKTVGNKFDFTGYTVWQAGEIAWSWTKSVSPVAWISDFKNGVGTDYIFPNKPV